MSTPVPAPSLLTILPAAEAAEVVLDAVEDADVVVDVVIGVEVDEETDVTIGRLYAMLKLECRTMRQELESFSLDVVKQTEL